MDPSVPLLDSADGQHLTATIPYWHHVGMNKGTGRRNRHLSAVSNDRAGSAQQHDLEPAALFDVAVSPELPRVEFDVPPGVTTADVIAHLAESGAPPDILERAAGFGDDIQALLGWVDESAAMGPGQEVAAARLLEHWQPLLERGVSALDAELFGMEFLAMFGHAVEGSDIFGALGGLIDEATVVGGPEALAMARVFAHVGPPEIRSVATAAAHHLATAGVKDRPWVRALGSAKWVSAHGYVDPNGTMETLSLEFQLGTKTHSCVVLIDHLLGGGVKDCWFAPQAEGLLLQLRLGALSQRIDFLTYSREQAGAILEAALALPPCPVDPDQIEDLRTLLPLLRMRAALVVDTSTRRPSPSVRVSAGKARRVSQTKPTRRSTIHRVKVTLASTKPPIWRRLEVPSVMTLAELHEILQTAFDWDGGHLWVYETPNGEYGLPDPQMNFEDARRVSLGSAAPSVGSKITYVYDFGDDWRHLISVEAIGPSDDKVDYPRCTAGRRAAPPEDCGGPWGYENLLATLADPREADHASMLEWLALDSADEFDPAEFDVDELNHELAQL